MIRLSRNSLVWLFFAAWVLQLVGLVLLQDLYPVGVYEPVIMTLSRIVPEAWCVQGDALLGLLLLLAATLAYAAGLILVVALSLTPWRSMSSLI